MVLAALLLSLAGCLGSIADTPQREDSTQNVGTGEGDGDDDSSAGDGDASQEGADDANSSGDGDGDGDESAVDDGQSSDADAPGDEPPADDPPSDEPPADDPPAEDPPADEPPIDEPPADSEAASLARGEESYGLLCVGCHGADGRGRGGVRESEDLQQLADIIDGSMPLGNPGACSGTCPEDIARYILENL